MTLSQSFKKIICDSTLSVSHILQALNELTQLVYLQNADAPVIAFLPERYQVFRKNQHFFFQRTQDFCYIRDDEEIDISSNIQPSSEQKEASLVADSLDSSVMIMPSSNTFRFKLSHSQAYF